MLRLFICIKQAFTKSYRTGKQNYGNRRNGE